MTERSVGTRLDQLPGDVTDSTGSPGFGSQPDLASSPAEKKAAAKAIEDHIEPDTRAAGDWANAPTCGAVTEFRDGWVTSGALKRAHAAWDEQVRTLMNRLSSDKAALRAANNVFHSTDTEVGANSRSVSVIDGY
ncbi:hypothetical protein [Streptomyces sp. NPDC008150]|uniref:hypothetical protein n=1 Tax=Streptomyces sp. NPDC008150 TaxID=3364816 RepID=UPI0036EEFB8D